MDIAGHSSAAMSLWYILLTRTVSISLCITAPTLHSGTTQTLMWRCLGGSWPPRPRRLFSASNTWRLLVDCNEEEEGKEGRKRRVIEALTRRRGSDETCNCSSGLLCCGPTGKCRRLGRGHLARGEKMSVMRARRKSHCAAWAIRRS